MTPRSWLDDYPGLDNELRACVRVKLDKRFPYIALEGMKRLIAGLIWEYNTEFPTKPAIPKK